MEEDEDDDPTRKFQLPPQTLIPHLSRKELRRKEEGEGVESRKKREEEEGSMDESRETKGKSKVPFHIPTIRRPQEEFSILVNNGNEPFEHVWLERSEDGTEFVHPLDKLSIQDFVERSIQEKEIVEPLPIESTPFKLVEGVKELKEMAAKLREVNEFAVDLEHNQYRSFQGLTCLMQISTRFEDFVIDTLKLRVHIGPYLREVFKDPSKRKVMHGADQDIQWLQRDFGIYVCNLFDTGQASRVLQLDRNSLEHLLNHFCGVIANKEYQNADWRLRPLTDEMLKYAREDTHYLLHIYDLMRNRLLLESPTEIYEVYQRSSEVCKNLYQKDIITATSFLHIYGILEMDFNSKQLAIADGLYRWRDKLAREEDESTGFILPNKLLLDIAKQMPVSSGRLRRLVKSKHAVVEHHLSDVVNIIRHSIERASDYETIVEQLEMARLGEKYVNKVEHIQSSLTVPFHSLSGVSDSPSEPICSMVTKQSQPENSQQHSVYTLESNETDSAHSWGSYPDTEAVVDPVSLSDLSSGFQQCYIRSVGQKKDKGQSSQEPAVMFQERPFDKAAGEYNNGDKRRGGSALRNATTSSNMKESSGLQRQASPTPSGNGSTTYK